MAKRRKPGRTKKSKLTQEETVWEVIKQRFGLDDDVKPYSGDMQKAQTKQLAEQLRLLADEIESVGVLFWKGRLLIDSLGLEQIGNTKVNVPGRWRLLDVCWLLAKVEDETVKKE